MADSPTGSARTGAGPVLRWGGFDGDRVDDALELRQNLGRRALVDHLPDDRAEAAGIQATQRSHRSPGHLAKIPGSQGR